MMGEGAVSTTPLFSGYLHMQTYILNYQSALEYHAGRARCLRGETQDQIALTDSCRIDTCDGTADETWARGRSDDRPGVTKYDSPIDSPGGQRQDYLSQSQVLSPHESLLQPWPVSLHTLHFPSSYRRPTDLDTAPAIQTP